VDERLRRIFNVVTRSSSANLPNRLLGSSETKRDNDSSLEIALTDRIPTMATSCTHLDMIHDVTPGSTGCEECLKIGDQWIHLRICLTCGHVGCCESSKNKHAMKHYHSSGHPLVQSFQPGEDWRWCYEDKMYL
jgi:uncharacterized UBP type Zn finger protein